MSRARTIGVFAAAAVAVGGLSAPSATAAPSRAAAPPEFADASVHDPSLVTSGDELWVFGSHLAAARTEDLMRWELMADLVTPDNPLFEDVTTELAETFEWAEADTLWAADVARLEDGRYYMYYNACRGDSPRSAMGVAVADDVDGPYEDLGIILRSGHREGEGPSDDGTPYDARVHPNVVDPDTFFDADGNLWMVYGSYSGGVFILEMDEETGLPEPGQGYGTRLTGGNHARIEGPTIQYDPGTGYYYLYLSFGGLAVDGGYNMRVARATHPAGPYYDAEGNDMREVRADPDEPIFDDASIEPFGTKLMGNHLFQREVGDPGTGPGVGYVSPGHNTTYRDPDTGRTFLIFHTRFPGQGDRHEIRVHETYLNDRGWPVVAPYRYAGAAHERIQRRDLAGDYRFINHGKAISADVTRAQTVTLTQNGAVSGAVEGRWQRMGDNRARLTLGDQTYDGVFSREWNPTSSNWVVTFSVLSEAGVSLWGSQVEPMTDDAVVQAVVEDLTLGDTDAVVADLDLPTRGTHDASISWTSSAPDVISPSGEVTRPPAGADDAVVILTAEVTKGTVTVPVTFTVTVLAEPEPGLVAHYPFDGDLAEAAERLSPGTVTGERIDGDGGALEFASGVHGDAVLLDGTSGVRLPDGLISSGAYSVALWVRPDALTPYTTTFFGARDQNSWVSLLPVGHDGVGGNTMVWSGVDPYYDGDTGLQLPSGEWSHLALTVADGEVRVYVDGEVVHEGTGFPDVFTTAEGTFGLGVNWWDTPFEGAVDELQVHSGALTAEEVAALAAR
ncbi:LamG-like jellyroll fold domain-containing protein [Georgenia alba]|uniref:LamG-like jellyroll fold domain-containing protein n=1 Tax=Georgenia alba TaxID=2233858 RepID=A0ABW2Q3B4_9MICO